ncbi:hypothetical protein Drorol1_Dr00021993 [Drosera rotundifolia]
MTTRGQPDLDTPTQKPSASASAYTPPPPPSPTPTPPPPPTPAPPPPIWIWFNSSTQHKPCTSDLNPPPPTPTPPIENLYTELSNTVVKARPTVLWCYKNKDKLARSQQFYRTALCRRWGLEAHRIQSANGRMRVTIGRVPDKADLVIPVATGNIWVSGSGALRVELRSTDLQCWYLLSMSRTRLVQC